MLRVLVCLLTLALPALASAQTSIEVGGAAYAQLGASLSPEAPRALDLTPPWFAVGGGARFFLRDAPSGVGASVGWTGSGTVGRDATSDDLERELFDLRLSARVGRAGHDRFGLLLEVGPSLGALIGRTVSCTGSGSPGGYVSSLEPWEVVSRYEPPDPRRCTGAARTSFALGGSAAIGIELHFGPVLLLPHVTYRVTAAPTHGFIEHELTFGFALGLVTTVR